MQLPTLLATVDEGALEQGPLVEVGLPAALFIIMIGMGLTLTPADFKRLRAYPVTSVIGSVLQVLALPAVALGIAVLLDLPAPLAVGMVIIAACPGGTTSNVFAYLARGNLALSIVLTVATSTIAIISLPLIANAALSGFGIEGEVGLPIGVTMGSLFGITIIPIAIGMLVRARRPALARRLEGAVSVLGVVVLALFIVLIAADMGLDAVLSALRDAGPAAALLNVAGIGVGLLLGVVLGLTARISVTLAVELGVKNGTIGLFIALTMLGDSVIALPSAVYSLLMFAFGAVVAVVARRVVPAEPEPATEVS